MAATHGRTRQRPGWSALGGASTLLAGVAFVLLQMVTISAVAYGVVRMQQDDRRAAAVDGAGAEVDRLQRAVMEVLVTDGSSSSRQLVGAALERLDALAAAGVLDEGLAAARTDWPAFARSARSFREGKEMSVGNVDAMIALGRFSRIGGELGAALQAQASHTREQAGRTERRTLAIVGIAAVLNGVGTCLIYWLFFRRVTRPLRYATQRAAGLASGDFSTQIDTRGGEATQLLHALAAVQEQLGRMIGEIRDAAQAVLQGASDLATGNRELSARTEAQAGTLEETASSMEELTSTVQLNAQSAQSADALARSASDVAVNAGRVVGEVGGSMDRISAASRRIGEITGVIDGIAFQTNILALNAAVEAARAGEQGRGFAVVAAEVRQLAQRSAGAAREIKALVEGATREVDDGTRLSRQAGVTMAEVVASVGRVTGLIAAIAAAGQEQGSGIAQVNAAVVQMDSVVQQNASLVEEASAATDMLRAQANALLESISRFRLREQAAQEQRRPHELVLPAGLQPRLAS